MQSNEKRKDGEKLRQYMCIPKLLLLFLSILSVAGCYVRVCIRVRDVCPCVVSACLIRDLSTCLPIACLVLCEIS